MTNTTNQSIAEWEEYIALTFIISWTFGLITFVNAFGNYNQTNQWYPVGQYKTFTTSKPITLYKKTMSDGEIIWRYKTAQSTWSYPRAVAVRRRARGLDLWSSD